MTVKEDAVNDVPQAASQLVVPARDFRVSKQGARVTPAIDKTWDPPWIPDAAEWYWFAREYSRCYRYHFDCAEYRIASMHKAYLSLASVLAQRAATADPATGSFGFSDQTVTIAYWEFDAFLAAINSALDVLARLVGVGYLEPMPPSFNRLCGRKPSGIAALLTRAQTLWVRRMKDYRDCFVHYTPVGTLLMAEAYRTPSGWRMHMKLPVNPNVRDVEGFQFSRRTDLMPYAAATYRHFVALDRAVATEIRRLYKLGEYPKRTQHLFGVGARRRTADLVQLAAGKSNQGSKLYRDLGS